MAKDYKQSLITYLLKHREYVAGAELLTVLGVSTKTISRAVKAINAHSANGPLIESRRGRGYRLDYQAYLSQNSHQAGHSSDANQLTSVGRRNEVIRKLLITSPEKHRLNDLYHRFYVSESVISTDLKLLRQMLSRYQLDLKRRNDYVWVVGTEVNIREAINDLLVKDDVTSISHFLQANQNIRQQDASFVTRQLNYIEEQMGADIPYPYNINLFSHLYVLIERYQNVGKMVDHDMTLTDDENAKMNAYPKLVSICKQVIDNLDRYLNYQLPRIEVYYLFQYLTSSRVDDEDPDLNSMSEPVRVATDYLIDKVTEDPHYRTINNQELFNSLAQHMKPLLNRLENNIKVKNNLLEQINLEYPHLFKTVKRATQQLSKRYNLSFIDDEEVGFITVYFAQAVENTRPPVNIMVVCTTGLGTAQLLRSKIERRFSELNIVKLVAGRELNDEINTHPEVDLVVSTINLPNTKDVPVLVVSAMFTMEDQERLEKTINQIRKGRN